MPDTSSPNAVRRAAGLPLPSTAPLTAAEREALATTARLYRLVAERCDEALQANRVDLGLHALQLSGDAGVRAQQLREILGAEPMTEHLLIVGAVLFVVGAFDQASK